MKSRPGTIADAVSYLASRMPTNVVRLIRGSGPIAPGYSHFGLGLAIRNELGLWDPDSPLLAACQTTCADHASGVILTALWQHLVQTATVEELALARQARRAHDHMQEQGRSARLDVEAAEDALITTSTCPHCAKPCPSYRKTCKHCRRPVRGNGDRA